MSANPLKPLTIRQQRFAELVAAGCDKTDAYRQAFNPKGKPEGIWVSASRLASRPDVASAIEEMVAKARAMAGALIGYGLQDAVKEAHAAYEMARSKQQANGMSQAVFLKARLLGLLAEDRKNERTPLTELTDEQLHGQLKDAMAGVAQSTELAAVLTAALEAMVKGPAKPEQAIAQPSKAIESRETPALKPTPQPDPAIPVDLGTIKVAF